MRAPRVKFQPVQNKVVVLNGGINENVSSIELKPGELVDCKNYQIYEGTNGGYTSIAGYERFSGKTRPSELTSYVVVAENCTLAFNDGDTIEGATSGASAVAIANGVLLEGDLDDGDAQIGIQVLSITGTFTDGEDIEVSSVKRGEYLGTNTIIGGTETYNAAIEDQRDEIEEVPGEGAVRGVHLFEGTVYAFRDKVGGATGGMYKSTSSGWEEVAMNGITTGLQPGGTYRFTDYNFFGSTESKSFFFTNGVNKAMKYNETDGLVEITTGASPDTPVCIAAHNDRLFLSFSGGSLQYSTAGWPLDWTTDAQEIGMGKEITDLIPGVKGSLIILCDEAIKVLQGYVTADFSSTSWTIETHSERSGAYGRTANRMFGTLYFMDDRGVTSLGATEEFGDMSSNSISQRAYKTIQQKKTLVSCSTVSRDLNQYRLFFSNGEALYFSFQGRELRGVTKIYLDHPVTSITENEDADGNAEIYFTTNHPNDDGYVFQMDSGTSFDGAQIPAWIRTAFFHYGAPRNWKKIKDITFEISTNKSMTLEARPYFDYSDGALPSAIAQTLTLEGSGPTYGQAVWGTSVWGGSQVTNRVRLPIHGTCTNMSVLVSSSYAYTNQHTVHNFITDFQVLGRRL